MRFDELNQLKKYYSIMEISELQKNNRVELANKLFDAIYFVFLLIKAELKIHESEPEKELTEKPERKLEDVETYKSALRVRIEDVYRGYPVEEKYIPQLVDDVIDTTLRHLDDEYFISRGRAIVIAQNESNTVLNYGDFLDAKDKGKKYKTWITEKDSRVRLSHEQVDEVKIPIDDFFTVGGEPMRYPHDPNGSPDNIINCRCVCKYE